jgi:hypothetical protein
MVYLFAFGFLLTTTPAAYCQWDCNGTTCRIDLVDGLPVELMDFSVESGANSGPDGARGDEGGDDSTEAEPEREGIVAPVTKGSSSGLKDVG